MTTRELLAALAAAAVALAGCSGDDTPAAQPSPTPTLTEIERVVDDCVGRTRDSFIYEGDDGRTLIVDGIGDDDGISPNLHTKYEQERECVFDQLGVPEATRSLIGQTRALDGIVEDSWDGYEARWTYHPDDGLDMTIEAAT